MVAMVKYNFILIVLCFIFVVLPVANAIEPDHNTGFGGGGLQNNIYLDRIRNALQSLSVQTSCPSGFSHCFHEDNIYGDARASADVYVSDPYKESTNLYVDFRGTGSRYYIYRGITSWSQVHCDSNGCDGTQIGDSAKTLLGSSPSTSQSGVVFVVWDYDSYNGYWTWTWAGFGWFGDFRYNLISTPIPTPVPTPTPLQGEPNYKNGDIVCLTYGTPSGEQRKTGTIYFPDTSNPMKGLVSTPDGNVGVILPNVAMQKGPCPILRPDIVSPDISKILNMILSWLFNY